MEITLVGTGKGHMFAGVSPNRSTPEGLVICHQCGTRRIVLKRNNARDDRPTGCSMLMLTHQVWDLAELYEDPAAWPELTGLSVVLKHFVESDLMSARVFVTVWRRPDPESQAAPLVAVEVDTDLMRVMGFEPAQVDLSALREAHERELARILGTNPR